MSLAQDLRGLFRLRPLQLLALTGLLVTAEAVALKLKLGVLDYDVWWHLKIGDWILQHRAVPYTGILSRTGASRPWIAYSWGYEVILSRVYQWFGLLGLGTFGVIWTVAVAYAVFWMLRRLSGRFWVACLLTFVTCYTFLFTLMPRPVFVSMALFAVTLTLVLEAQRSGRMQPLYWLPPIFVLWANIHIQFVYGLFLIGLLVGVNVLLRLAAYAEIPSQFLISPTLPLTQLFLVLGACGVATLIGPYSFHLYQVIFEYTKAQVPYSMIQELQPRTFRFPADYVLLLLTFAGFFAVGRQKKVNLFKLALLCIASVVAYRTARDSWFIALSAAACIADFPAPESERVRAESLMEKAAVAAVLALMMVVVAGHTEFNERGLDRIVSRQFPVDAVNFLRKNPIPGPLYNNLNWGGFLTWYLPNYPVAVDGRNDLYGDELDKIFFHSEVGDRSYLTDPYLNEAGVILLQRQIPLTGVLSADPRFRCIYQDQIAAIFVRQQKFTP